MRAVAGMQLAGEILSYMNSIISGSGSQKLGIQFGAYATFLSFFGLADLPRVNTNFTGMVDYASSMAFELFTNADVGSSFPAEDELQVRFLFHNGTASNASEPSVYPLFGSDATALPWNEFKQKLGAFAISSTEQWCNKCGNTAGSCAAFVTKGDAASSKQGAGNALSPTTGGVIGAFVTLAVVLGSLAALMLFGGFRLVSKKALEKGVTGISVEPKA
jgi:hypothetical protein